MDAFEINKIVGAVLGTLVFVLGLNFLAELVFHSETPEMQGYIIEVAQAPAAGEAEAKQETSLAALLAGADADKGQKVAKKCAACHSFDNGGKNKVGPNLWNIVNRAAGSADGFKYSAAMTEFGGAGTWTFENLDGFLTSPKTLVPKTSMSFAGLKKAPDRANMIAYLRSLSDSPAPLPAE